MISTIGHLNLKNKTPSNNIVDGTTGDWEFVSGENNLYVINHKDSKKYKINLTEVSQKLTNHIHMLQQVIHTQKWTTLF